MDFWNEVQIDVLLLFIYLWEKVEKYILIVQAGSSQKNRTIVLTELCVYERADRFDPKAKGRESSKAAAYLKPQDLI